VPAQPESTPVSPPAIEASAFVLKDSSGAVRARLGIDGEDKTNLIFYAPDGKVRAVLGTFDDGEPYLEFCDERENTRFYAGILEDNPGIFLLSREGGLRAMLSADADGTGRVMVTAGLDGPLVSLYAKENAEALLLIEDAKGKMGFLVRADEDGTRMLSLSDREGEDRLGLWISKEGVPGFTMLDEDGEGMVGC
jgi:hypothetical protein